MRTCIKSQMSLNFGQIGPLTTELVALRFKKFPIDIHVIGKWCLHASSFIFDRIIIKVAGNKDGHKSSDEFDFRPLVSMANMYVTEMRGSQVELVDDQKIDLFFQYLFDWPSLM